MTSKVAFFALLCAWGVGTTASLPALAQEVTETTEESGRIDKPGLTDRVWTKADGDLPGVMRIFLSDGTLVQDSCWETHRLSSWQLTSDTSVTWDEDGMEIAADIVSLTDTELVLNLKLVNDTVEETYVAATVPFLCPDIPK